MTSMQETGLQLLAVFIGWILGLFSAFIVDDHRRERKKKRWKLESERN